MTRHLPRAAVLVALAACAHWAPAVAQNTDPDPDSDRQREAESPLDRFGLINGTQFQMTTGTDDDTLTVGIDIPAGPSQENRFSLILSTPLHGGDDAQPASLDALASGSKATLRWGRFKLGNVDTSDPEAKRIKARAMSDCLKAQENPADPKHREFGGACNQSNRVVHRYALPDYRRYQALVLTSGILDYGLDASVGVNDFEWIDPATFVPQKKRRTSWSVAAHLTQYLVATPTALTGSVSYQRAYEPAEEQLLCPPNTTDPATDCKTARGAGPARDENLLITAGIRHRFLTAKGTLAGLAVAPAVTYDVLDDVFGVDVPVYLVPNKDGDLTGGIRFGYRSDRDDKFSIGVFFGAAFNLWQR